MQQLNLFQEIRKRNKEQINLDLFQAYFDARKNKRNTNNALAFEKHLETNIFELSNEIIENAINPNAVLHLL